MHTSLDILLVHAPKIEDHFGPVGRAMSVNYLAVGLPALAARLERSGHRAQIVHLGVEKLVDPDFDLGHYVRARRPRVVGFSLHWHAQIHDTVQAIRTVRQALPQAWIVAGGFTASWFHTQAMDSLKELDGVLRGDAEASLLALTRALASTPEKRDLEQVPGLTWRRGEQLVTNDPSPPASAEQLDSLEPARFDLVKNFRTYLRHFCGPHYVPHRRSVAWLMQRSQQVFGAGGRYFVLPAGRGCTVNCAWCGGGWSAHRKHSGRTGVTQPSPTRVADWTEQALEQGFEGIHACFDPTPSDPTWWCQVFDEVGRRKLQSELFFESFHLPHDDLLAGMTRSFRRCRVALSPESPDPQIRRRVRGFSFSNEELISAVRRCDRAGVEVVLCFGYGLPWESQDSLNQTRALARRCQRVAQRVPVLLRSFPIQIEPGAPWSVDPERFGIQLHRRTFEDYLRAHTPGWTGPEAGLGYSLDGYFPSTESDPSAGAEQAHGFQRSLHRSACRELCPLPPSPTLGRFTCQALRTLTSIAP